jgi:ABC-2 type transport system permease protein
MEPRYQMTAFLALLRRDLTVASRNALPILMGTLTQPVLVVLVFGNILPRLHLVADEFRTVMVPGLMSITMLMAGVQGVLMPLTVDLSGSREVDERLLAPISVLGVALEKVVAGAIHAGVAGLVALPAMMFLMHRVSGVDVHPRWAVLLPLVALCGLLSAAFGLTIGSQVQPRFSGLLFAVILGPMMLFGCAYYPWMGLSVIGPFQFVFLLNPLVFMSEAMRLAVTPDIPHMPVPLLLGGAAVFTALFTLLGARAFERRTIL